MPIPTPPPFNKQPVGNNYFPGGNLVLGNATRYTPYKDDAIPEGRIIIPFAVGFNAPGVDNNPALQQFSIPNLGSVIGSGGTINLNAAASVTQISQIKAIQFSFQIDNPIPPPFASREIPGRLFIIGPMNEVFIFRNPQSDFFDTTDTPEDFYPTNPILNACIEVCTSQNPSFQFVLEQSSLGLSVGNIVGQFYNFERKPYVTYASGDNYPSMPVTE